MRSGGSRRESTGDRLERTFHSVHSSKVTIDIGRVACVTPSTHDVRMVSL